MFKPVSSRLNVNEMELNVLDYWQKEDIFHSSVQNREGKTRVCFFTRARQRQMASRVSIMYWQGCSRTSSHATGPCADTMSSAGAAGIHTACRLRSKLRRNSALRISSRLKITVSLNSTSYAGNPLLHISRNGRS